MESNSGELEFRFAIDRGGTFTDVYCEVRDKTTDKKEVVVEKLLSVDPNNYKDAPTEGIRRILERFLKKEMPRDQKIETSSILSIRMGTTVATNALLERKGERTALFITKGFKDLLHIGNQSRPQIFDLILSKPHKLYEEVVEVEERILPARKDAEESDSVRRGDDGILYSIVQKLDEEKVRAQLQEIKDKGFKSIAIIFMHSYAWPEHEHRVGEIAAEVGFEQISKSADVMARQKIVKRGDTCTVDAYLNPHINRYLKGFKQGFDEKLTENVSLFFMQSDGGLSPMDSFRGSKAILSGPAGGVVGYAQTTNRILGEDNKMPVIGFDMGGTSTDVSRYDKDYELIFETNIAGVSIQAPQLDINTVAAGGGSRLFFRKGLFVVGPESASADPGPVCYRKNGYLAVTDANLVLGRLLPEFFPKIFGKNEDQPLDKDATKAAFDELAAKVNKYNKQKGSTELNVYEVAHGFIKVANEAMSRPIRSITQARGINPKNHILSIFGGAGGQHGCAIAKILGIKKVVIHKYCGILSAYGMGLANVTKENEAPHSGEYNDEVVRSIREKEFVKLEEQNYKDLKDLGFEDDKIEHFYFLNLRYEGTDTAMMVCCKQDGDFLKVFRETHQREFGFTLDDRVIYIDNIRVQSIGKPIIADMLPIPSDDEMKQRHGDRVKCTNTVYFEHEGKVQGMDTPVYDLEELGHGFKVEGPAIILNKTSTIIIEPNCTGEVAEEGSVTIDIKTDADHKVDGYKTIEDVPLDPIELSIFGHRFMSIAEQMGTTLQKTSVSTNIKERLDFSCAIFGPEGNLIANAPHLPVHLGSMQEAVKYQVDTLGSDWKEGEVILANHPMSGGTHLPDMTVITPVFKDGQAVFYVASRGHHADIGGISAGSMPAFSKNLLEEGTSFKSFKLVKDGKFQEEEVTKVLTSTDEYIHPDAKGTRNLRDNISDYKAQVAANNRGIDIMKDLFDEYSLIYVQAYMNFIQENAEMSVREMLKELSKKNGLEEVGSVEAVDYMDDGTPIKLKLTIDRRDGSAEFDFEGTGPEVYGNTNAPKAITYSAIIYCLRCLVNSSIPLNQGCLNPISVKVPDNCILNPSEHAAVVGGNVLTSQRITDVVLRAFNACAASQGCMNNLTFGNDDFGYYETIAGGAGAGPTWSGQSGIHTHMTNTRITDPEVFEARYPVYLREFSIRENSGGEGKHRGGDGVIRDIEFLEPLEVSIISERRSFRPYGLEGGNPGEAGMNLLIFPDGRTVNFGGKNASNVPANTRLRILTPGGGGFGNPKDKKDLPNIVKAEKGKVGSLQSMENEQSTN